MSTRTQNSRTSLWLASIKASADPRGDLIETLRGRRDLPSHIPNARYLYCFVRDRFKSAGPEHLQAVQPLYDEYKVWCARYAAALRDQREAS